MTLDKSQILEADDREYDTVQVPEWGGEVRIQTISAKARDDFHEHLVQLEVGESGEIKSSKVNQKDADALLCTLGVVDEDGNRIFQKRDYEELREKAAGPVTRVAEAIRELNEMEEEAQKKISSDTEKKSDSS